MLVLALALTCTLSTHGGRLSPKETPGKDGLKSFLLARNPTLRPNRRGAPLRTHSAAMKDQAYADKVIKYFDEMSMEEFKSSYFGESAWAEVLDRGWGQSYAMNPRPSLDPRSQKSGLSAIKADVKAWVKDPLAFAFTTIRNDKTGTISGGVENWGVESRTIKPPPGFTAQGKSGDGFFGFGDISAYRPSNTVKLLSQTEKLGVLSLVSDNYLLSKAEGSGLFSSLEAAGALSTAEKALPLVEKLGLLSIAQGIIDEDPSALKAGGALLVGLAPIYAALDAAGVVPDPGLLPLALGGLTTTAAGAALLALAQGVTILQSGDKDTVYGQTVFKNDVKLLARLEELGLLSTLAEQGVLSKVEEAGVLSSLESSGAFSTIEKTLPLVEKLGLLSVAQDLIDNDPSTLSLGGAILATAPALFAALDVAGVVPDFLDPGVLPLALGGLASTSAGLALVALSNAIYVLQRGKGI